MYSFIRQINFNQDILLFLALETVCTFVLMLGRLPCPKPSPSNSFLAYLAFISNIKLKVAFSRKPSLAPPKRFFTVTTADLYLYEDKNCTVITPEVSKFHVVTGQWSVHN